jgi:hypothetical protein
MRSLSLVLATCLFAAPALAGFTVSSFQAESRKSESSQYGAQAALDGNPATAWMIDPEQANEGQWIELEVPQGKVDKVSVIVGWAQSDKSWADHARVAEARIEVFDAAADRKVVHEQLVSFEDKRDRQVVELPDVAVGDEYSGGVVRLTVTKVHPGKDYAHLALGEMLVHLVEFDAQAVKLSQAPASVAPSHDGLLLVDGDDKTFWASAGTPSDDPVGFEVDGGRYSVSSIGLVPGPKGYARPKKIEVTQSGVTRVYDVVDTPGKAQWFELPPVVGYTGSGVGPVTVTITEVHDAGATAGAGVAIAEVKFRATMLEAF